MEAADEKSDILGKFELGMHRFATRTGEAIEGKDRETHEKGIVWILRAPLADAEKESFLKRLKQLESLELPVPAFRAYGVAEGNGYLITEYVGGGKLPLSEEPIERKIELFRIAIEAVAVCHQNGVVLGDICEDSFIVRPKGDLSLIALLGSFDKGRARQSPPAVVFNYFSPEQRSGMAPGFQSDVFALGVLGYRLFSGAYPAMRPISQQLQKGEDILDKAVPPSSVRESVPLWIDSFIGTCLSRRLDERYRDAASALVDFDRSHATGNCSSPGRWSNYEVVVRGETSGVMKSEGREIDKTTQPQVSKEESQEDTRERKYPRYLFLASFGVILGVLAAGTYALLRNPKDSGAPALTIEYVELLPPELKQAVSVIIDPQMDPKERIANLERVAMNENPATYSVLSSIAKHPSVSTIRAEAIKAVATRLKDLSYTRTAETLESWTSAFFAQGRDPAESPLLPLALRAGDLTLPLQVRRDALHRAFVDDSQLSLRLATALSMDDVDEEHFVPVLRQLLVSAGTNGDLSKLKLASLITLNKTLLANFERDLVGLLSGASIADISIMLESLAQLDNPLIYEVAGELLRRKTLSSIQSIPLKSLLEADRLHTGKAIKVALVRFARGEFQEADVGNVGKWQSLEFEPVLLAVCARAKGSAVGAFAFELLAGRGVSSEPAQALLKWFQTPALWSKRRDLVFSFGVLGLHNLATDMEVAEGLEPLMPYAVSGTLLEILVKLGDARLIRMTLERVAAITSSEVLLLLIKHIDPKIRIASIRALEGRNEIRVLQDLVRGYEREKDPDVRKVYEENHWVVRNR